MVNAYLAVSAALLLELIAGTPYAFSAYSSDLKHAANLTQTELNAVSSVGNVGLYLGIVGGAIFDAHGPTWTVLAGASLSAFGYLLAYFSHRTTPRSSPPTFSPGKGRGGAILRPSASR